MARSLSVIRMDFRKANQQAKDLDALAKRLKILLDRNLNETLDHVSQNWKGENSDRYVKKGRVIREHMRETASEISQVSNSIQEIAKAVYDAEMRAWEIAHDRD
ncbi:WXG100 family type VII secretion target [Brotaphodocola sp.]|uniref:WXG100 family type VII secretion target n=1 Tax=Brotaphodocola sp. TaxID=3073577 RepID=UPI003D7E236F